ncbi:MAG: hypothetical protein WC650_04405 [Candidatus Doudnabacteria bacterium]
MGNIKQQLEEMYNIKGMSVGSIAKRLNVSYGTVRRYFQVVGIEVKKRKRQTKEQIVANRKSEEEILRLLKKNGWSIMGAAKSLGVKYDHLKIWMDFYKIPQKFSRKGKGEKMTNEDFIKKFEDWTEFNLKT